MSKRIYEHLMFEPSKNNITHLRSSRPVDNNIPEHPDDYYKQKRKELKDIQDRLKAEKRSLSVILKITGEPGKDFFYESLDRVDGSLRLLSIKEDWSNNHEKW